ncbi:alpha/beta hydrolase family protein [Endozoicomonas numazuensis]|uniref:dienelactone hydrolase family protein n=1 Tax=Endozoicomonas numazuensis TaxID=1137799 RepID=UPI00068B8E7B|nr:dienelactone hydrolase family protein [Endozoicomonas numazuensis]
MKHIISIIFFSFFITACHTPAPFNTATTEALVTSKQLKEIEIHTSKYTLKAWTPKQPTTQKLRIYIEGDGKAWLKRGIPSTNPTPVNRLVHSLMLEDPHTDIAYLGRPCQYILTQACNQSVWTFDRYDSNSLASINEAIDHLKEAGNYKEVEIIGYSGGATLALLSAAHRNDVKSIWTLAGNLDPRFTNEFHQVTPMPSAMNPIDFQKQLQQIPQLHFYGSKDPIIPYQISKHYTQKSIDKKCISVIRVEDATHSKGWKESWNRLIKIIPSCRK